MEGPKGALRLLAAAFRTVLRGFGLSFVVLVLIVAGVGIYAQHKFGPEEARAIAVSQLQALLHREVTIEKMILSPRGLKIKGLRVRRASGSEGDQLVCDTALVTVKLRPLLRRRLEFDAVRLESPQIFLTREADGTWDIADLFTATKAAPGGALPLALAAAETIVNDGVLKFDDRKRGRKISFERLTLRADSFDQDQPFPLELSFVNAVTFGTRTLTTSVSAEGVMDLAGLRWSSATATAHRFTAEADGVTVTGSGSVAGFQRPVFEIEADVPALGAERWPRWTGRDLKLSLPATKVSARVNWSAQTIWNVERLAVATPAGTANASGVFDLTSDTASLSARIATKDAVLENLKDWHPSWAARDPRGKAALSGTIEGKLGALQLKEAVISLRGFGADWGDRRVEILDLDAFVTDEFASVKASVTKGRVVAYGNAFDDIAVTLSVAKQTLTVENLALRWGESRLRLRGRVDRLSAPKEVLISGNLDKIVWEDAQKLVTGIAASISTRTLSPQELERRQARPWVSTFKYVIPRGFPDTAGHLRVTEVRQENFWCKDLDLLWSIRGVTPALDKVGGEARVRFGPGRVADIPAVQDSHKLLRVIFLPFIYMHKMNKFSIFSTATAYPKTLDFQRIESEYGLTKGVATTRYFHVDSPQLAAFAEGTADFAREQVDMNVLTRLAKYDGVLPEWWVDEAGRPSIGFRVKGDLNKPELEPRFKKIPVDEIERKLEEGRSSGKKRFDAIEKLQTL
ncbi:MAG: AsmA family protein [Elusimicrobia bacterium]|nr:AsmA family protein [Elusimicrobiota bacterium]